MSDRAMAERSYFICVLLLLLVCLLHASDNRHIQQNVDTLQGEKDTIQPCSDMRNQLGSLNSQLLEMTQDKDLLNQDVLRLRREGRQLVLNLTACSLALSSVTGLCQTQLQAQTNLLLDSIDSETFHVLKIMIVVRDLNILQHRLKHVADLDQNSTEIPILEKEEEETLKELNAAKQKINGSNDTLSLILQIASLQDQILDLSETELTYEAALQRNPRILALQEMLNGKIYKLRNKGQSLSEVLELVSVRSKITLLEKRIQILTEESRSKSADAMRRWKEKAEQLKQTILLLIDHESNTNLTREILKLQMELQHLKKLISNPKEMLESTLLELTEELKAERKQEAFLQKKLEEAEGAVAQLIVKIVSMMKELRAQERTSPGQRPDILTLLQTSQTEVKRLQEELQQTHEKFSGLEESSNKLSEELKIKVEENQHHQTVIQALRNNLIQTEERCSENEQKIKDLQNHLDSKTDELNSKSDNVTSLHLKEMEELKMCCSVTSHCEDLQRQLQQSREAADNFHYLLQVKEAALNDLKQDFHEQEQEKNKLQEDYMNVLKKLNDMAEKTIQTTKITLDPETAHPRIILSADRTEVSMADSQLWVQDNSSRFDVSLAILGSTGYSSGRHYWEVSVSKKSCYHIGMATESAPRKGLLSFRPVTGYWTIIRNKQGELRALDETTVTIQAETHPLTLGVLLDYKKGQISFYDAGTRSHVYTFSGQTFTERIYPFINYCVENVENPAPLVLVQPGSTDWIK